MAKKRKRKSRKMPSALLAHFAAKTLFMMKKRGIKPELNAHKK